MTELTREVNQTAAALTGEILAAVGLHGQARDEKGLLVDRALKRFAKAILDEARQLSVRIG